jgi:hypothetical protein
MLFRFFSVLSTLFVFVLAAAVKKQAGCSSYTIINTRGTGEPQGQSSGFRTMNANIQRQVSGGSIVRIPRRPDNEAFSSLTV